MTKQLIINFVIAFLLLSCKSDKSDKNDLSKRNLKGQIQTIKDRAYNAIQKFGEIVKDESKQRSLTIYTFNKKGFETSSEIYLANGVLLSKQENKYNPKDYIIEMVEYDENALLKHKTKYVYKNESKNYEEEFIYAANGTLERKNTYKYDKLGNLIEERNFNSTGIETGKSTSIFDKNNNEIEVSMYGVNPDTPYIKWVKKYDNRHNVIERNTFGLSPLSSKYNTHLDYVLSKYDENNNEVETQIFDLIKNEKSITKIEYKYDKKGNWIKRTLIENGIPNFIEEREMEYY